MPVDHRKLWGDGQPPAIAKQFHRIGPRRQPPVLERLFFQTNILIIQSPQCWLFHVVRQQQAEPEQINNLSFVNESSVHSE